MDFEYDTFTFGQRFFCIQQRIQGYITCTDRKVRRLNGSSKLPYMLQASLYVVTFQIPNQYNKLIGYIMAKFLYDFLLCREIFHVFHLQAQLLLLFFLYTNALALPSQAFIKEKCHCHAN